MTASFVFFEVLTAHRADAWTGMSLTNWTGIGVAALLYFLASFLLIGGVLWLLGASSSPFLPRWKSSLAALFAGGLIWLALFRVHDSFGQVTVLRDHVFVGLLLAGQILVYFLPRRPGADRSLWIWLCFCLAGAAALSPLTDHWLPLSHRAFRITLGAAAYAGGAGLAALLLSRRAVRSVPLASLTLLVVVLPSLAGRAMQIRLDGPAADAARPNLLLITCDAMRADYCAAYGGPAPTPALEDLAAGGALFRHSYSLAPWTLPSVGGMMGSYYPPGLTPGAGKTQWERELDHYWFPDSARTLAQLLAGAGYRTMGVVANPLLRRPSRVLRGMDYTVAFNNLDKERLGLFEKALWLNEVVATWAPRWAPLRPLDTSRLVTRYAQALLRRQPAGRPFFLWLHYMDPHSPYNPPQDYRAEQGPWPLFSPESDVWDCPHFNAERQVEVAPAQRPYVQSLYRGEVRYVDACIGEVLNTLDRAQLARDSYVCITSDHGEELWDHGGVWHGPTLYDEVVRVPLILRGPGLPAQAVQTPFSAIDLMPTCAALLNVPPDDSWAGVSWADALRQGREPSNPSAVYIQATDYCSPEPRQAIVQWPFKLIRGMSTQSLTMYDLESDAEERSGLSGNHADRAADLNEKLVRWSQRFPSSFADRNGQAADSPSAAELKEQMRSMGYLH